MSEKIYKVIYMDSDEARFQHPSGAVFEAFVHSCGEAVGITDAQGNEITTIPTDNEAFLTEADIELACTVITSISLTKALKEYRAKETQLIESEFVQA